MPKPANDTSSDGTGLWDKFITTHLIKNARVVAILHEDGGSIVENHAVLEVDEGRAETFGRDGRGVAVSSLNYHFMFRPHGEKVGERCIGYPAKIVISGTAENGLPIDIRGEGFIGQDENGTLDGTIESLPSIYTPEADDIEEHLNRLASSQGNKPSRDFIMATYGHAQDWS